MEGQTSAHRWRLTGQGGVRYSGGARGGGYLTRGGPEAAVDDGVLSGTEPCRCGSSWEHDGGRLRSGWPHCTRWRRALEVGGYGSDYLGGTGGAERRGVDLKQRRDGERTGKRLLRFLDDLRQGIRMERCDAFWQRETVGGLELVGGAVGNQVRWRQVDARGRRQWRHWPFGRPGWARPKLATTGNNPPWWAAPSGLVHLTLSVI
jgi:hypothetical protein